MKVKKEDLAKTISLLLAAYGAGENEQETVSRIMIEADSKGIATHGLYFLPMLLQRIESGLVQVPTNITEITNDAAIAHLDGGNGIGQTAAEAAMNLAIEKAGKFGIGMCMLRNTNHVGLLGHYSLMAANRGMLGICMCNSAPAMAPWGGAEAMFGTNPFSIAAPAADNYPIALDMSTSLVARGKIRRALRMNEPIPEGWAFDADGKSTTDPEAAMAGTLMPVGGPKGYGMALFIDMLCGLVAGSSFGKDVKTFHKPLGPTGVGFSAIAVDISRFIDNDKFEVMIKDYIDGIKSSKKAGGVDKIYMPGEIEADKERNSLENGIQVDDGVIESVNKLLKEKSINFQLGDGV